MGPESRPLEKSLGSHRYIPDYQFVGFPWGIVPSLSTTLPSIPSLVTRGLWFGSHPRSQPSPPWWSRNLTCSRLPTLTRSRRLLCSLFMMDISRLPMAVCAAQVDTNRPPVIFWCCGFVREGKNDGDAKVLRDVGNARESYQDFE